MKLKKKRKTYKEWKDSLDALVGINRPKYAVVPFKNWWFIPPKCPECKTRLKEVESPWEIILECKWCGLFVGFDPNRNTDDGPRQKKTL